MRSGAGQSGIWKRTAGFLEGRVHASPRGAARVLATKEDNSQLRGELKEEIARLGADMREEMAKLRAELIEKIAGSKVEIIRWMFVFWIGLIPIIAALIKFIR